MFPFLHIISVTKQGQWRNLLLCQWIKALFRDITIRINRVGEDSMLNWLISLFRKSEPDDTGLMAQLSSAVVIENYSWGTKYISKRGLEAKADPAVLIIFGHNADNEAKMIAGLSTLSCVAVEGIDSLKSCVDSESTAGLMTRSRMEHVGEAGEAIALFQQLRPGQVTLYGAWDYHTGRAADRAVEYKAHGLIMPAMDLNAMMRTIFTRLATKIEPDDLPLAHEDYLEHLKETAADSPFWEMQDLIESQFY